MTADEAIEKHSKLVHFVLRSKMGLSPTDPSYEDLAQDGYVMLLGCAERYDENIAEFSTYAIKILFLGLCQKRHSYGTGTLGRMPSVMQHNLPIFFANFQR